MIQRTNQQPRQVTKLFFYSTVVKLIAGADGYIPATQGRLAHGAFLDIIRTVDPALSESLHTKNQRRPFTISPLQGAGRAKKGQIRVKRGQQFWLRFTLLNSDLFATFTRFLLMNNEALRMKNGGSGLPVLRLGEVNFIIAEMLTTPGSDPWAGYTSAADLYQGWQLTPPKELPRKITIQFASGAFFSRSSNKNGMGKFLEFFPYPEMFFGSLAARWNDYTPLPLNKETIRDYAAETVVVSAYKMETKLFHYWGNPQFGAVGQITYQLKDQHSLDMIRTFNLLADFAFFSGVGAKTAMGMGMVRRIC